MNEKVTKFYELVSADGKLQEELTAVTDSVDLTGLDFETARKALADAVGDFAAEHDLDLTAEDIIAADIEGPEGELSEAELATVAGGQCGCFIVGAVGECGCFIAGGNNWDGSGDQTSCAFFGI